MATASQVKAGLDDIAAIIRDQRNACLSAKARITAAKTTLNAIPATYADLIATIDGYAGGEAFEDLAQAEKAKLAAEFTALKNKATTAETALAAIDFTT